MALANEDERSASTPDPRPTVTPAAVRPLRTPMALAVADVADEPPRNGRLLPVKRVGAGTAEVRGSIAVGTSIAERPPLRSVRAGFPHTAPTSGV